MLICFRYKIIWLSTLFSFVVYFVICQFASSVFCAQILDVWKKESTRQLDITKIDYMSHML